MTTSVTEPTPTVSAPGRDAPIGIVVVSFGSADLLRRNLAPAGLGGDDVHIVVVDNFSSRENRLAVEELGAASGWHVVGMPDNRGFGAACNAGVAVARELGCRTFLFLNPDAVISPAVVAELRAHSLREPMALISPRLVDSTGRVVFRAARTDLRDGRIRSRPEAAGLHSNDPGDWLCGACVVVHDELLSRIDGYDEGYFLYWEDVDLGYRAVAAGGSVILRDDLVAVHDEGGTHGRREGPAKSPLYYRYNCRNRLAFAARNLGRRDLLRWMLATPAVSWEILLRGGRRQLISSPGLLRAALSGSVAGLALAVRTLVMGTGTRVSGQTSVLVVHPGAELYGSDRVLLESVAALSTRGEVTVVVPGHGPLVPELEARGARVLVRRMPVLRKSVLRPSGMLRLLRDAVVTVPATLVLLRRHGRNGVYVNTTTVPSWVLLGRLTHKRVICHVHEAEWPGPTVLKRALLLPLLAAHTVVANSRFTREVLVGLMPALGARSVVVPNPVLGGTSATPARARLGGEVRLVFLGRLSPRKGPDVAIAVLRELVARGVDARLDLAGSVFEGYEWFEAQLHRSVARAGLGDRVTFRGFCPDVWPVLADADIVLIPSVLDESFGNAAVEAVMAARPTVVSALGGLEEATAGFTSVQVVEAGRPALWADAVEHIVHGWSWFRAAASVDAGRARSRHATGRYRDLLAGAVVPRSGPSTVPAARLIAERRDMVLR